LEGRRGEGRACEVLKLDIFCLFVVILRIELRSSCSITSAIPQVLLLLVLKTFMFAFSFLLTLPGLDPPTSVSQVARIIGVHTRLLNSHFQRGQVPQSHLEPQVNRVS
jgi:hypothetical protein